MFRIWFTYMRKNHIDTNPPSLGTIKMCAAMDRPQKTDIDFSRLMREVHQECSILPRKEG